MAEVWVATIHHRHGFDTLVGATEEAAQAALSGWLAGWWHDDPDRGDMPEDAGERIADYFSDNEEEYFDIECLPVLGA